MSVSGGASLGGTGSIGGTVVLAGGSTAAPRGTLDLTDGAAGTLRLTDANASDTVLTLGGSAGNPSLMNFEVGAAGADRVLLDAGKLVVNPGGAIISIMPLPGFGVGTYDLINFDAGQATGLDRLSLSSYSLAGYTCRFSQHQPRCSWWCSGPEPGGIGLVALGIFGLEPTESLPAVLARFSPGQRHRKVTKSTRNAPASVACAAAAGRPGRG